MANASVKAEVHLFQFAVILHPTPQEQKKGAKPEIASDGIEVIVAKDLDEAKLKATLSIAKKPFADQTDRLEVRVQPFCRQHKGPVDIYGQ